MMNVLYPPQRAFCSFAVKSLLADFYVYATPFPPQKKETLNFQLWLTTRNSGIDARLPNSPRLALPFDSNWHTFYALAINLRP